MIFQYEAYSPDGSHQSGVIEAKDKQEAALKLYQRDLVVFHLRELSTKKTIYFSQGSDSFLLVFCPMP